MTNTDTVEVRLSFLEEGETRSSPLAATTPEATRIHAQMLLYARDLRLTLQRERKRATDLATACENLRNTQAILELTLETERHTRELLEQAHRDTIIRLMRASRFKDEETGAHVARVSRYAALLASKIGLAADAVDAIAAAAPMHDLGKIALPDAVLQKRGPLTRRERETMMAHTTIGADLLSGSEAPLLSAACEIALTHHERWDGSGYPCGLKGKEIPVSGHVVMLADVYDALRSPRYYKPSISHDQTCSILLAGDERTRPEHFDPALLEVFATLEAEFECIYNDSLSHFM